MLIAIATIIFFILAYNYYKHVKLVSKMKFLPGPSFFSPITWYFSKYNIVSYPREQIEQAQKYGKTWKMIVGNVPFVMTMDTDLMKEILVTKNKKLARAADALVAFKKQSLFSSHGKVWKKHRELASPAFSDTNLKKVFETSVREVIFQLRDKWKSTIKEETEINVTKEMKRFTFDVISSAGFGVEMKALEKSDDTYIDLIDNAFYIGLLHSLWGKIINLPLVFKKYWNVSQQLVQLMKKALYRWKSFLQETVESRREESEKLGSKFNKHDLLSRLMTAVDEQYQQFDNEELLANCHAFMSAGMDTTAITLAYVLYYMAMHPEIQENARKEAIQILENKDHLTYEDYQSDHVKYIKCIIKETLRLRPPGIMFGRKTTKEMKIGNYTFPKNTRLFYMNALVMTDKSIWGEDALEFRPERFLNAKPDEYRFTFLPFSYGPRTCIGKNFAEMEMVGTIAMILKHFKIGISEDQKVIEEVMHITFAPKNPIKLKISPIT